MSNLRVTYEATPNPQSLKFVVAPGNICSESLHFANASDARRSPLALKIFGFPWAAGVFIGPDFVTISKQDWVDWDILADPLAELIREHFARGEPVLSSLANESGGSATESVDDDRPDDPPVIRAIKRVLREEIRPAVAMDGGDVTFERFEDGRVYLRMRGACSGCPSSAYTLKEGIETRLRDAVPEVVEVLSIESI